MSEVLELPLPGARRGRPLPAQATPPAQSASSFLFYIGLPMMFVIGLTVLGMRDSFGASLLTVMMILLATWFARRDSRRYGGVTFASCFVAVSTFVFAARAIYVILNDDFSIIARLGVPFPLGIPLFVEAMAWVLTAMICFIAGAMALDGKALITKNRREALGDVPPGRNLTLLFLVLQITAMVVLAPAGMAGRRVSLTMVSDNAYVYLLPTLVHGFNLYAFVYIARRWRMSMSFLNLLVLLVSFSVVVVDAYFLYNMSSFRGFYTVGLFTVLVAFLLIAFRKVSLWLLLGLFAIYPLFKSMGFDRSLSNEQVMERVILRPLDSFNKQGMDRAYGNASDINMLDTLIASLQYQHRFRPYVLSYLYVFVHWVPRKVWPGKPRAGVLADVGYTHGIPYSPGIIGFINDDGGELYMLVIMGLLGWFMRWWQIWTDRIRTYELRVVTWAAFFLTALVTVRYLPYQSFYGFLIFFVPALLYNWLVYFGRKPKPVRR